MRPVYHQQIAVIMMIQLRPICSRPFGLNFLDWEGISIFFYFPQIDTFNSRIDFRNLEMQILIAIQSGSMTTFSTNVSLKVVSDNFVTAVWTSNPSRYLIVSMLNFDVLIE
jgi:hypothetical protein